MYNINVRKRGQIRIIEAGIAASIIFITFIVISQSTRLPRITMTSRTVILRDTAYNTLYRLADSGVFESLIGANSANWERSLKMVLDTLLPSTVYFNMSVYSCNSPTSFAIYNKLSISNVDPNAFIATPEITSASFLFVAKNSRIYLVILQLAEGGS
jgi:hypothetical protein